MRHLFITACAATCLMSGSFATPDAAAKGANNPREAKAPTLKINGFTVGNMTVVNQQIRDRGRGGSQPHMGLDDAAIFFTVTGSTMSGIEYMYRVNFATIPGQTSSAVTQNYIQFSGSFGSVQFGAVRGATNTMIYDASRVIGGTGGFEGNYGNLYNVSALTVIGNDLVGDTKDATKFNYYSPIFWGFQFGLSYTPATSHFGQERLDTWSNNGNSSLPGNKALYGSHKKVAFGLRNVEAGLTWKKEWDVWSIILSVAGLTENSYFTSKDGITRVQLRNAKAIQTGLIIGYKDFKFGAGYLDNGRSRLPRGADVKFDGVDLGDLYKGDAGKAYNVGIGYTMGAYQIAASYQGMVRKTDAANTARGSIYSATLDFTPFQGLKVYGELDHIKTKTNAAAQKVEQALIKTSSRTWETSTGNNSATLLTGGVKISF